MSLNGELAEMFRVMAAVMDIKGENAFKAISFSRVSRLIADYPEDMRAVVKAGKLGDIQGVGPGSRKVIEEYVATGRSTDYDEVVASVPAGLLGMLEIPGMGPKTVALLWKEREITSVEELATAIAAGKLAGLKGIGEKKIEQIKQGIALRSQAAQRMGILEAQVIAESLVARLRELPGVKRAEIAGSLRRRRETVGDVDLVSCLRKGVDPAGVGETFSKFPEVTKVIGQGTTKTSVLTAGGLQVDLRIVPEENFGAALMYFTGSKDHNVKLRGIAQDKGMTLNEWGLYKLSEYDKAKKKTGEAPEVEPVASAKEEEVYAALGMVWVEPELREDRGEVECAQKKTVPKLIAVADIRGDLHTHTKASDGVNTIEEMAEAALARGYEVLAITDHSKSQVIANGLTAERLLKHVEAIHKVGAKSNGITLLAGCEVDILVDGRLDFDDDVLKELDWVVASPHASLRQDQEKATARILRAIENKYVNVIGHPTGRLINRREGLPLDFARIFKAAAESGTALEINAGYPRLDLNDVNARGALAAGCVLSINTDAHSTAEFDGIGAGVSVARRAWAEARSVINTWTVKELTGWVKKKRG